MIRQFLRKTFPLLLDILFVISAVFVVIGAIGAGFVGGFGGFLSALIFGSITLIMSFGVINILLDIRDALEDKRANSVLSEKEEL